MLKNLLANAGDAGYIPGQEDPLEKGMATPLQYFCLGSPKDRGGWSATVHGAAKESHVTERLQQQHSGTSCLQISRPTLPNLVIFSHRWLFNFKCKIK